ncbi:hypothetical protein QZH41_009172, partial [Actinostola sp. cb2023]
DVQEYIKDENRRCPHTGGVHMQEVSTYRRSPHTGGVHIQEVSTCRRCPHTGVHMQEVSTYRRCPHTGGVHIQEGSTYRRGPHIGGVHIQEGSTCRRGPHAGGVHMQEVSTCRRCPHAGGVHMQEVSTWRRCPHGGGVHMQEVSTCTWRCPHAGGVHMEEVSTCRRCPHAGGVHMQEVSTYRRCPHAGGVHMQEVSTWRRCPHTGGVHIQEVSTYRRCPHTGGVHIQEVSTYRRGPHTGGVHIHEVSTYMRCPHAGGVHIQEVSTYRRCPHTGGVHIQEVSTCRRCPHAGGIHMEEVSTWRRCPHGGGVHMQEVSTWRRCPHTGGVHIQEVSTYRRCPHTGGVHIQEVSTYRRGPHTGGVHMQEVSTYRRFAEHSLEDTAFFQKILRREMKHWLPLCHELESVPERIENYLYYIKSPPEGDDRLPVICRRVVFKSGSLGIPQIILNQNELATLYPYVSVSNFKLSPSRKLAAFTLDSSGMESYLCHVTKVWDGPLDIMDIIPSAVNCEWGADDSIIFYTTRDELNRCNKLWKHKLGDDVSNDILMYEEKNERFFVDVSLINIRDCSITHNPLYPREQGTEYYIEHRGNEFIILTNSRESDYRVMRVDESNPDKKNWRDIRRSQVFIDDMEVFKNYCILYERRLTSPRLSVVSLDDPDDVFNVQLPHKVSCLIPGSNQMFKSDVARFTMSSPIFPPQVVEYDMSTGSMKELHPVLSNKPNYSSSDYECTRLEAPSLDGTMIPVTVFHHKHVKQNGKNPMLVHVYGSYGMNIDMSFTPERLCLLTRGWVVAFCHVRGGGELGRQWYHQATLQNKHKSFEDFEAGIKTLQEMEYSRPTLTAAKGVSAGGLVVGAACNRSPDLFKAAVLKVPYLDVLTSMLDSSLPLTAQEYDEWGDPRQNEDDFNHIKSYCPYYNITKKDYPSILIRGSMHDERVPYWMPLKWVAKMRAENKTSDEKKASPSTSSKLLLCTIDEEGGHFGSGGIEGVFDE